MSSTNSFFPRRIALVLRIHILRQGRGVIAAYDVSGNSMGKLSLVLMSVPQKAHGKFDVVKKRVKKLE